jgi:hypothetical protein
MKRPDLRIPMSERRYAAVEKPIAMISTVSFQDPSRAPCAECPLRRTSLPGALGGYTVAQYIEILHGIADIACHMSPGFPNNRALQRSCTGIAMYRIFCRIKPWGHAMEAVVTIAAEDRSMNTTNPRRTPMPDDGPYLVWSHEHSRWWAHRGRGYVRELSRAGRFTRDDAIAICTNAIGTARNMMQFAEMPVRLADIMLVRDYAVAQGFGEPWE